MAEATTRQRGFDIAKAIACVAVVLIHYNFKGLLGSCVKVYCTFAVPTFFLISGYFLTSFDERGLDVEKTISKVAKLVRLLLCATAFYAIVECLTACASSVFSLATVDAVWVKNLSAAKLAKFFITNDGLFCLALWFIGALIACYCLVLMTARNERALRRLWWVIVPCWLAMSAVQEFAAVVHFKWNFIRIPGTTDKSCLLLSSFWVFRALPFFLTGTWVRAHHDLVTRWQLPNQVLLMVFMLSGAVSIAEYFVLGHRVAQFYMGSYVGALALFCWAMRTTCGNKALSYIGCELSMLIYVLHCAVGKFVDLLARYYHWWGSAWFTYCRWLLVLIGSVLAAVLIRECYKKFRALHKWTRPRGRCSEGRG